ncbi:MAG: heavy metal-binding domain-containing protein [Acidimicrobiales bacterium]
MTDVDTPIGLPPGAIRRLSDSEEGKGAPGLFTSDLSVNEFLLVKEAGFRPRGLVFGSSIFHIGYQRRGVWKSRELGSLTQAMYTARELAMTRMEEEASILGANGVVAVRLNVNFYDWGRHSAEFIAIGTAVSAECGSDWQAPLDKPFTSDLSGQDFWTLIQTGYAPIALVLGTCVYRVAYRGPGATAQTAMRNAELPHFTQALYEARELAMTRMQEEARSLGAEGIVGVQLVEKSHFWGSHVVEFLAIGTAIRPIREDHVIPQPSIIMTLDR